LRDEPASNSLDYYAVLRVREDSTSEEIEDAYRRLAKRTHPDHNRNDPTAHEKMQLLNEAYAVLGDPKQRTRYDSDRANQHEPVAPTGPPDPEVRPAVVDFGILEQGETGTATVRVFNHGGPVATVRLEPQSTEYWSLRGARGGIEPGEVAAFDFQAHTESVAPGSHRSTATVYLDATPATITFLITLTAPEQSRTTTGGPGPATSPPPPRGKPGRSTATLAGSRLASWVLPSEPERWAVLAACISAIACRYVFKELLDSGLHKPGYMVLDLSDGNGTLFNFLNRWTVPVGLVGLVFAVLLFAATSRAAAVVDPKDARSSALAIQFSWLGATLGSASAFSIPLYNLFYLTARADGSVDFRPLDYVLLLVEIPLFVGGAALAVAYIYWVLVRLGRLLQCLSGDVTSTALGRATSSPYRARRPGSRSLMLPAVLVVLALGAGIGYERRKDRDPNAGHGLLTTSELVADPTAAVQRLLAAWDQANCNRDVGVLQHVFLRDARDWDELERRAKEGACTVTKVEAFAVQFPDTLTVDTLVEKRSLIGRVAATVNGARAEYWSLHLELVEDKWLLDSNRRYNGPMSPYCAPPPGFGLPQAPGC
jgi:hypothetical protein